MKRDDMAYLADAWRKELSGIHMPESCRIRALSRMKGEKKVLKRTLWAALAAALIMALTIGGTLALHATTPADQPDEHILTLDKQSCVIPATENCGAYVFTLEDAFYDGKSIFIAYRLEGEESYTFAEPTGSLANRLEDVDQVRASVPFFPEENYQSLKARLDEAGGENSIIQSKRLLASYRLQNEDGKNMNRWVDVNIAAMDGVCYVKYDLRTEASQIDVDGAVSTELFPEDAVENVWYDQDEITVTVPIGIQQQILCRDDWGNETWVAVSSGEGDYYISIPISRTDEMEKRMVCENVLQVNDCTYAIFASEYANMTMLSVRGLQYDGDSICIQYTLENKSRIISDVPDRDALVTSEATEELLNRDGWRWPHADAYRYLLDHPDETALYLGRYEVLSGEMYNADGMRMRIWLDDYRELCQNTTSIEPTFTLSYTLRTQSAAKAVVGEDSSVQPWVLQDSITVYLPIALRACGAERNKDGECTIVASDHETEMRIPLSLVFEEIPLNKENMSFMSGSNFSRATIMTGNAEQIMIYMGVSHWYEEQKEQSVYIDNVRDREFNAPVDVPMRYYVEKQDTWHLQASAASYLNEKLGVLSVTERGVAYGEPQNLDGEDLSDWIEMTVEDSASPIYGRDDAYDKNLGGSYRVHWREGADLSRFAGQEEVDIRLPVLDVITTAAYDERGDILVGQTATPIEDAWIYCTLPLP